MIISTCKKCGIQSNGQICAQCGKKATTSSVSDVWNIIRNPLKDPLLWINVMIFTGIVTVLLFLFLFVPEKAFGSQTTFNNMMSGGTLISVLAFSLAVPLLVLVTLLMQRKEELRYTLDMEGAHCEVWHKATVIRSLARLQTPNKKNVQLASDGTPFTLSQTRHIAWKHVKTTKTDADNQTIYLYHTVNFAPFVLHLTSEEFEMAKKLVEKHAKKKRK